MWNFMFVIMNMDIMYSFFKEIILILCLWFNDSFLGLRIKLKMRVVSEGIVE